MVINEKRFIDEQNWLLVTIGAGIFILAIWMTIETAIVFLSTKKKTPEDYLTTEPKVTNFTSTQKETESEQIIDQSNENKSARAQAQKQQP